MEKLRGGEKIVLNEKVREEVANISDVGFLYSEFFNNINVAAEQVLGGEKEVDVFMKEMKIAKRMLNIAENSIGGSVKKIKKKTGKK